MGKRRPKWLNVGVSGQVGWPKKRSEVDFGGQKLLLLPRTKTHLASVHIDVADIDPVEAMSLMNRFLSLLSWCERQPLVTHYGWSGNAVPVPVPAPHAVSCVSDYFAFVRNPLTDPKQQLALALYREGLSLNSVPFQFLSFFKILNIFWNDRKRNGKNELVEGIRGLLPKLTHGGCRTRLAAIQQEQADPACYLYKSGRCAVTHAYEKPLVDPDAVADLRRLSEDIGLVRAMAEHMIVNEMGISRCLYADAAASG